MGDEGIGVEEAMWEGDFSRRSVRASLTLEYRQCLQRDLALVRRIGGGRLDSRSIRNGGGIRCSLDLSAHNVLFSRVRTWHTKDCLSVRNSHVHIMLNQSLVLQSIAIIKPIHSSESKKKRRDGKTHLLPMLINRKALESQIPPGPKMRLHRPREIDRGLHPQIRNSVLHNLEVDGDDAGHLDRATEGDLPIAL